MSDYVKDVRLLRPVLYNNIYNNELFKTHINRIKTDNPEVNNIIIDYYPFSVYLYYNNSDETTKKLVNYIDNMLREIISTNRPMVDKFFNELYQDRSVTNEDRDDFYNTVLENINKVYSYNIIPQNDIISMMNIIL